MKQQPTETKVIQFLDEGGSTPIRVEMTEQLAGAVARAVRVNEGKDRFLVSFTSLFVGLLATPDPTGEWLQRQFRTSGADLEDLLRRRDLDLRSLEAIRASRPLMDLDPERQISRSASARSALTEGQRLARDLGALLDTRHVMAAYISIPAYHDQDFRDLKVDRVAWAQDFSREMASRYSMEAAFWQSFSSRVFPQAEQVDEDTLDLEAGNLEPHVVEALRIAAGMHVPVEAGNVARAVVALAESSGSAAFKRFAEITTLPRTSGLGTWNQKTVRLSETLSRQLAIARRPRAGESAPRQVWGRDLVTAVLLSGDAALANALSAANQPLEAVRDRWFGFVTSDSRNRTRDEWHAWWLMAGVPTPGPRRSGIATETDQGDDKLGVEAEARAFARLIMDKQVQPPLSIGLLGDWGSGKSFFIEQIKKQIGSLKAEGRSELFGNVVEIEFNAWHASDSNLWASLVTHIFDEIWANIGGNESPEAAQQFLVEAIGEARGAIFEAEGQVELARTALATAEKELEKRKANLALNKYIETAATTKLKQIAKDAGWHQAIETINDVDSAVESLAVSSNRLRLVMAALIEKPILHIGLPTAVLAGLTVVIWFAVDQYEWMRGLPQWAAAAVASIGAVVAPIKAASLKVGQLADRLTRIRDEYDEAVKSTEGDKQDVAKVGDARRELESAEASVAAAKTRLAELLNQQAALDPRKRLGAFLEDRVQSTLYRSQQGIISLVHRDFQQLSKYMKELRDNPSRVESTKHKIRPLERIVLYVDDLDRCRPAHVVAMLEAVHLLLALDLFVVVVAVDSRWLTRALELHYKELIGGDDSDSEGLRASTPQNYLEKIFQVTYALGPMDPLHFKDYVAFLAGAESGSVDSQAAQATAAKSSEPVLEQRVSSTTETKRARRDEDADNAGVTAGKQEKQATTGEQNSSTLPPSYPVRIDEDEQKVLCRLVPLLPTPRIAKRLVNVYRLIKASKTADALEEFQRSGRAPSNLLMLAILFGKPAVAPQLLRGLHERVAPFDDGTRTLRDAIRLRTSPPAEPEHVREEWRSLLRILEEMKIRDTVEECAREPIEIARYSLVAGHDWHTWGKPQQQANPKNPHGSRSR